MDRYTLTAELRDGLGKEFAKKIRQADQIPAIFYGPEASPTPLTLNYADLEKIIRKASSENIIIGLEINRGHVTDKKQVMLKELQTDPVKDRLLHADFYEIRMDQELVMDIPVTLINSPKGLKMGGILQHLRRELTVSFLPDRIVDHLELDVSDLDIGDTLHISDIQLPVGMKAVDDEHLAVATVIAPSVTDKEGAKEALEEADEEAAGETEKVS